MCSVVCVDGQAYSIKIQGQLHRVLEKIKKKLKIFNSLDFIAQKFDLSSVLNLDSALYVILHLFTIK